MWRSGWPSYARRSVRFECGLPSRLHLTVTQFGQRGKALRKRFERAKSRLRKLAAGQYDALVLEGTPGSTTVVTGTASFAEMTKLAEALRTE